MLFDREPRFRGLSETSFGAFDIRDPDERRRAIVAGFHPFLEVLGEDLKERLDPLAEAPLFPHLPRLDWPRGYRPFCTWLALSRMAQGYQSGPQLNLGVHRDHVAARFAWDTQADAFGRFEFLCRHGGLGEVLHETARAHGLRFRVYASAPWPEGSRRVHESDGEWEAAFAEARRRGVWFELGVRHDLPAAIPMVTSAALFHETRRVFASLLGVYDRVAGHVADTSSPDEFRP